MSAPPPFYLFLDGICSKVMRATLTALSSVMAVTCASPAPWRLITCLKSIHLSPSQLCSRNPQKIFFLLLLLGMGFCIYFRPGQWSEALQNPSSKCSFPEINHIKSSGGRDSLLADTSSRTTAKDLISIKGKLELCCKAKTELPSSIFCWSSGLVFILI